ncbi:MAG: hypothetical protein CME68_03790 [Halobacteriovoraceae bacterium]|nr:hypothetical protein [Halobacteriovoraceae bacterium]|tara:strand:+ start:1344 stop:1751 length:408 start_codon:yes stop_codon:yes gene_type:complete
MKNFDGLKNNWMFLGALFLFLAVAIGAFGAHGLTKLLDDKALDTFKTGVTYQFYHGLALLFIGLCHVVGEQGGTSSPYLKRAGVSFTVGIILFSFNCYFYALTKIKFLAMVVPFGGMSFLLGWAFLIKCFTKKRV